MSGAQASAIPKYVSTRFVSVCLGSPYKTAQEALRHAGLRTGSAKTYDWREVEDALGRRFIDYDTIERVAAHVDASSVNTASYEVSKEIYDLIHRAWHAKGGDIPQGVVRARPEKRPVGRPRKHPLPTADEQRAISETRARLEKEKELRTQLDRERLEGHREDRAFKQLRAKRLAGMMCDREMVKQKTSELARSVQRFMEGMPGRVAGYLTQTAALTDQEVRIVEDMLKAELPMFLRELRRGVEETERASAAVASQTRYGEMGAGEALAAA